ncbi:HEPN domain-containing protein [Sphaerisporangium sp. NPDC049003]|uniref:ApeA N-terminal domain 1-containing protein n=1 Tax=Sphaerisporangium sp. NPDC049003 TaxID=3364517 RepID=UPI0037206B6A
MSEAMQPFNTGDFWLPGEETNKIPGRLTLGSRWQTLELHQPVTPSMRLDSTASDGTQTWVPISSGAEDLTIHGSLDDGVGPVTLISASTRRRAGIGRFGSPERHTLESEYAIIGGHVDGELTLFTDIRISAQYLDYWTNIPELDRRPSDSNSTLVVTYEFPEKVWHPLPDNTGRFSYSCDWEIPHSSRRRRHVRTKTWIHISLNEGLSFREIRRKFLHPLSALLTLLYDRDCPPTGLEVKNEQHDHWLGVVAYGIEREDDLEPDVPLLSASEFDFGKLGNWFQLAERMDPIPGLISGSIKDSSRTVQNRLLELATAAEGLHRRLYDGERRLSDEQVTNGLSVLGDTSLDRDVFEVLSSALRTYLWDLSFPMRVLALAENVADYTPGVAGKPNRWKSALVNARNGFAHGLEDDGTDSVGKYYVLAQSLRWLLSMRLFAEAGVSKEIMARNVINYEPYKRFMRAAAQLLPKVYGQSATR